MYLVDIEKKTTSDGTFRLYAIGDMHCDRRDFDEETFKTYIAHIAADPTAVAVFVGDALDGRIPGRKFFDADSVRLDFLQNLKTYVNHGLAVLEDYFQPLIKAGVPTVFISGNHDEYLEEIGLTAELVRRLGGSARYLGGEGFIRVRSGKPNKTKGFYTTTIYGAHGTGGGGSPGSKINKMQANYEWVNADVIMAGHVHDGDIRVFPCYGVQESGLLSLAIKPRVLYRAPAFTRRAIEGVVGYQGRKGYAPGDEGLLYVQLNPERRKATRMELEV
jgi:hypothetical protein